MDQNAFGSDRSATGEATPTGRPLLRFEHVVKDYLTEGARVHALNGLTLDVEPETFVALMGRSGCGKSTLLNLAGAMDFASSGRVLLDGINTAGLGDVELTRLRREKVGFIFQSFQLLQTLSVVENVELPLLLAGDIGWYVPRALEQLAAVGLAEQAGRLPHQLSGGQMQRVAIARALVHRPLLVLADEPTGNLDTTTGDTVLQLLRTLCRERHTTIIMATHSAEAAAYADTVSYGCVMAKSRPFRTWKQGQNDGSDPLESSHFQAHAARAWTLGFDPGTAVALGVAVVLAIDLASGAAAGSFRSSMQTLSGDDDLEVVATGGVPEGADRQAREIAVPGSRERADRGPCHGRGRRHGAGDRAGPDRRVEPRYRAMQ